MKKHFYLLGILCAAALVFTSCAKDEDDFSDSNDSIKKDDLEFPARKGGSSIVITHTAVLNELTGSTGVNYSVEWDTEKRSQRWSCYKMYSGNYGAGKDKSGKTLTRYSASNDGLMLPTSQYPNDPDLPAQYRLTIDPYKYSQYYDHGHICPSQDRLRSKEANYQTFYMTNMQMQYSEFNQGIWENMETQVRAWASSFDTLYVCKGGTIDREDQIIEYVCQSSHQKTRVNVNHVPVPKYFFMAVLGRTGNNFKATGFWINQASYSSQSLKAYAVNIATIQKNTGIDFFCSLPDDIESQVENVTYSQMQREWSWIK